MTTNPMVTKRVWVLALNSEGAPDLLSYEVECSSQDFDLGLHYDDACTRASEAGYDVKGYFDENDPAGHKLVRLERFESISDQASIPGPAEAPLWHVPLTVDVTLSATLQVRAHDADGALQTAKAFAAADGSMSQFSLDDGNYRGASDFYCADRDGLGLVEDADETNQTSTSSPAGERQ